jgi:hypothetical protein
MKEGDMHYEAQDTGHGFTIDGECLCGIRRQQQLRNQKKDAEA